MLDTFRSFSPDDTLLVTGSEQDLRLWNTETGEELLVLDDETKMFTAAFSPDGNLLAANGSRFTINLWELHE